MKLVDVQEKIFEKAKVTAKENLEISHRQLQQSIRELAILSNSTSIWASLVPQLRIATLRPALAAKQENWTADKDFNELKSTRLQAIREIATKPLMNLPLVITATAVVTFLGGIRLYPVDFVVTSIIVALGLHVAIILGTRIVIQRQSEPSTFSYAVMLAAGLKGIEEKYDTTFLHSVLTQGRVMKLTYNPDTLPEAEIVLSE